MKGAAFLWLPASLQLIAGVWLGPIRGLLAGGLGAYGAGILAYGGWGLPDIIMNPIAGGFANSLLPAYLFSWLKINPDFGTNLNDLKKALLRIILMILVVIVIAIILKEFGWGNWGYVPSLLFILAIPYFLSDLRVRPKELFFAVLICVVISFISAMIGVAGSIVAGQSLVAAFLGTGIGWFLGDTVSCILGLYVLAMFTKQARHLGITPEIPQ